MSTKTKEKKMTKTADAPVTKKPVVLQSATNPIVQVEMDEVFVDTEFNARKMNDKETSYEGVEELAKQIKTEGQLSPVMVRTLSPEERKKTGKVYSLVFGFRRFQAVKLLGSKTIAAQVAGADDIKSPIDAFYKNLAENLVRQNLKTWEIASRYSEMKDKFNHSGEDIAKRLGGNRNYVNQLVKAWKNVSPKLRQQWMDGASVDKIVRCVKDGWTPAQQWEQWLKENGVEPEGDAGEGEESSGTSEKKEGPERIALRGIIQAIDYIKANGEDCAKGEDYVSGALDALRFVVGNLKTIPGLYSPDVAAKEREAKKAAAKEAEKNAKEAAKAAKAAKEAAE